MIDPISNPNDLNHSPPSHLLENNNSNNSDTLSVSSVSSPSPLCSLEPGGGGGRRGTGEGAHRKLEGAIMAPPLPLERIIANLTSGSCFDSNLVSTILLTFPVFSSGIGLLNKLRSRFVIDKSKRDDPVEQARRIR
jgi:hypothetical protein